VFKVRVAYLQAINRVAVMFGENKRIEAALWFLMDRIHATTLEMSVLSESLGKANTLSQLSKRNGDDKTGDS
jgi:hypothetical protein